MSDVEEAVEFLKQANDAESDNRQSGLEALQFRFGAQWPQYATASRGLERPQLTINETNTYIKKVTNGQRQQRPRGKASPVDSYADPKIAKVITGLGRHIEYNSDADNAYDTAFDFAATIGWGYWRLRTDYIADDSFNQDIFIDMVDNPFTVYFDPNSRLPDGSDAEKALITDLMPKETFKKEYPDAQVSGFQDRGTGDSDADWTTQHEIRLAEFFKIERHKSKLVMLSDGTCIWEDEVPRLKALLLAAGIGVKAERDSVKKKVIWQKQTAYDILDEKTLPGKWIPIVPVYWTSVIIDGKRMRQGLVKDAMDPQRMVNFWQTSITESLAMGPKAKWIMAEGADEGHENEWKRANIDPQASLHYKTTGVDGQAIPPPERVAPEPPPAGFIEATFMASQNLSRVLGVFDPNVRTGAQHKSDSTLNAEQGQSEMSNFDGYDNLVRSIKHTWRIMLSWMPEVYDTQQIKRIIGEDGKDDLVTINQQSTKQNESGQAIETVLNDVRVGTYDVVMDVGPGYDTRRKEGVAATMELMSTPIGEKVAQVADDIIVRNMDFPGADVIADRLAAANPMSQIDEQSDVPPQAQMQIKGLQQQLQQAQQQMQAMGQEIKFKADLERFKQGEETKREHMRQLTKAHETESWVAEESRQVDSVERTRTHDTAVRAITAQNVEELRGMVQLMLKKIDGAQLERMADRDDTLQGGM